MSRVGRALGAAAIAAGCMHCGAPPTRPAESKLEVGAADAGTTEAGPHGKGPWTLVPARTMCWARSGVTYCAELLEQSNPAVLAKPEVTSTLPFASHWLLEPDGHIGVHPPSGSYSPEEEAKASARDKRAFDARKAVAKKIPPLTRLQSTWQFGCGLLADGDVTCWPDPTQMAYEPPVVAGPTLVPNAHHVTDLSLEGWSTLCVLTKEGAVLCSSKLPTGSVSICVLRGSSVRCGESTSRGRPELSGAGFDPRKELTRPLVAIPDVVDARAMASYEEQPFYDNQSDRAVVVSVGREGGCAALGNGEVRCWDRDPCPKGKDWRTQKIEGLADIVAVSLTSFEGYALDKHGQVFGWPIEPLDCKAPAHGVARPLFKGAKQIHAGTFTYLNDFATGSLACAAMLDETVACWRKLDEKPVVVQP